MVNGFWLCFIYLLKFFDYRVFFLGLVYCIEDYRSENVSLINLYVLLF